jgi:transcriptional regulator GlxA family with amidase domain
MTLRVGILLTRHFTLNALANFVDVLRLAADDGDGSRPIRCQWHIMSATGRSISASCGIQVAPTSGLIEPGALEYIAVIGGLIRGDPAVESTVREYLVRASSANVGLIGICTGTFVLCRLGLMNKRSCCISWYHYRDFLDEFDDVEPSASELYVDDGSRITSSGGVGAALVAAHLVERHLGDPLARKALHIMQMDKTRPGAKLQPAPPVMQDCDEAAVNGALLLMEQNLSSPLSIAVVARRLTLSQRTLQRLFQKHLGHGPLRVYMELRLQHAQWRLRAQVPIGDAAAETGFTTASAFSAAYKRRYGRSPSLDVRSSPSTANADSLIQIDANRRLFDISDVSPEPG